MRERTKPLLMGTICVLLVLCLALATSALATTADSPVAPDSRVIPVGSSAGGVDLGGLTVNAAEAKLTAALTPLLQREIVVGVAGHVFRFSPNTAKLALDAHRTAARAYNAGAQAHGAPVSVPLAIDQSQVAIKAFVAGIGKQVYAPARNASIKIALTHLTVHRSGTGHKINEAALSSQLQSTLDSPTAERVLHIKLQITHPSINANQIERQYTTVITVDRANFKLRLFKGRRVAVEYGVAVGRSGLETPTGVYHVLEREVNPPWHVPNSAWAGALAGTTVPPGPGDPIVARWMGLGGGIGIHGTDEPFSIGSAASHGCIRMRPADVIALYPRVPLGTAVYIK